MSLLLLITLCLSIRINDALSRAQETENEGNEDLLEPMQIVVESPTFRAPMKPKQPIFIKPLRNDQINNFQVISEGSIPDISVKFDEVSKPQQSASNNIDPIQGYIASKRMLDEFMKEAEKEIKSGDPPLEGTVEEHLDIMRQLKELRSQYQSLQNIWQDKLKKLQTDAESSNNPTGRPKLFGAKVSTVAANADSLPNLEMLGDEFEEFQDISNIEDITSVDDIKNNSKLSTNNIIELSNSIDDPVNGEANKDETVSMVTEDSSPDFAARMAEIQHHNTTSRPPATTTRRQEQTTTTQPPPPPRVELRTTIRITTLPTTKRTDRPSVATTPRPSTTTTRRSTVTTTTRHISTTTTPYQRTTIPSTTHPRLPQTTTQTTQKRSEGKTTGARQKFTTKSEKLPTLITVTENNGLWWTPKPSFGRSEIDVPDIQITQNKAPKNNLRAGAVLSNSKYISSAELRDMFLPHTVPLRPPVFQPTFIKPSRIGINGLDLIAQPTTTSRVPLAQREWARSEQFSGNAEVTPPTLLPTIQLARPTTSSRLIPVADTRTERPPANTFTRPYQVEHRQIPVGNDFNPNDKDEFIEVVEYYDVDENNNPIPSTTSPKAPINSWTSASHLTNPTQDLVILGNNAKQQMAVSDGAVETIDDALINVVRDGGPNEAVANSPSSVNEQLPFDAEYEDRLVNRGGTSEEHTRFPHSTPSEFPQSHIYQNRRNNMNQLDDLFIVVSLAKQLNVQVISESIDDAIKSANEDLYFLDSNRVARILPQKKQHLQILEILTSLARQRDKLEWLLSKQKDYVRIAEIITYRQPRSYQNLFLPTRRISPSQYNNVNNFNANLQQDLHVTRRRVAPLSPPTARMSDTRLTEAAALPPGSQDLHLGQATTPAPNRPNNLADISQVADPTIPADISELENAVNQVLAESNDAPEEEVNEDQLIEEFFNEVEPGRKYQTSKPNLKTNAFTEESDVLYLEKELENEKRKIKEEQSTKYGVKMKHWKNAKKTKGISRKVPTITTPKPDHLQTFHISTTTTPQPFKLNSLDYEILDEELLPIPIGNSQPQSPGGFLNQRPPPNQPSPPQSAPILNLAYLPPPQPLPSFSTTTSKPAPITGPFLIAPPPPPSDEDVHKTSIHDLIDMLHNDLHRQSQTEELTVDPACEQFQCTFENGDLCKFESSHDELTRQRRRRRMMKLRKLRKLRKMRKLSRRHKRQAMLETRFFTMRSWSVWTGKEAPIPIQIDEAPVFSLQNRRFAGVFLEGEQIATLLVRIPNNLRLPLRLRFRAFEATRDMQLRVCCDDNCPFSTESGITRGHRDWMPHTVSCPAATETLSFECINEGDKRGACGVDDIFLDSYSCPKLFLEPDQIRK